MAGVTFDDMDDTSGDKNPNDKPIWAIDSKDEESLRKWLLADLSALKDGQRERVEEVQFHIDLYKGEEGKRFFDTRRPIEDVRFRQNRAQEVTSKVVVNHLYDLTEQKISRLVKFKPAVAIIPNTDEYTDKVSADVATGLWAHISTVQRLDKKIQDILRWAFVAGEGYMWIDWDPQLGKMHPEVVKAKKQKRTAKVKDKDGVISDAGEVKVGDVRLKVVPPDSLFFEFKADWDDSDFMYYTRRMHTEEVKKRWPSKALDIRKDKLEDFSARDFLEGQQLRIKNQTEVIEFWHKPTEFMPKGLRTVFTKDAILESNDHPNKHGEFPVERIIDIEIPGEQHGRSFFINGRRLANHINNLTTMAIRNQKMAANPKWFVPKGSVKIDSLGNAPTIVQYSGPQPPVLSAANPTAPEVFIFRQQLKEDLQQVSGVFGVSRGEPPPGIKAGVALQFLDEQENNRQNATVARYNEFVRRVARKVLSVASQFYDPSDERMIMILGRDKRWQAETFDPLHLAKEFTLQIQNASALPESKAARTQTILDLREIAPGIMTEERMLDLLDFAQSDKFVDVVTAATKSAEIENEKILAGDNKESLQPQEYEFHIAHWEVHASKMQEYQFKTMAPKKVQETLKNHLMAHENLMFEQAGKNGFYQERLAQLKQFPLLMEPPIPPPPTPEELATQAEEQGASPEEAQQVGIRAAEEQAGGGLPPAPTEEPQGPIEPTSSV